MNGKHYAVDGSRYLDSAVAVRCCHFIHHGWPDSYPDSNRYHSGAVSHHSRAKTVVGLASGP